MNVIKIGGSTLRTAKDFERLAARLAAHHPPPAVVVVSALPMVTRKLEQAARLAEQRRLPEALEMLGHIVRHHEELAGVVLSDSAIRQALSMLAGELQQRTERLLRGVSLTGELTPRTLDRIVSVGEKLALHLLHHALSQRGLSVATLPASELIMTDAAFGNAAPLEDAIAERVRQRLLPAFDRADYILTEGFVGATLEGETTTMGKESSTLTAALLARQLSARELVLYTPVSGIFTADPMEVAAARRIDHLHYDDAERLARAGLKLLFPTMIAPLRAAMCILRITTLDASSGESTQIDAQEDASCPFVAISDALECITLPTAEKAQGTELVPRHNVVATIKVGGNAYYVSEPGVLSNIAQHAAVRQCQYIRVWARWKAQSRRSDLVRHVAEIAGIEAMAVTFTERDVLASAITSSSAPVLPALHEVLLRLLE
ncbi:MAG: aspartokinase [Candidatus Kapaibacterium sp.]|nr:MAG: aspartokinase [Candidatus Kapabacteria bacterium]